MNKFITKTTNCNIINRILKKGIEKYKYIYKIYSI